MGVQLSKTSHKVIFLIILPTISIFVTFVLNTWLQQYIPTPWILIIDSAGVLGIYTLLFTLFNDCLWQLFPQGMLHVVDVPNLNGVWNGGLRSSFDNNVKAYKVCVKVIQTFSEIKVFAYFEKSWSYSIVADFYKEADGRQVLHYVYKNEPRNNAASTMHGHYGAGKHEYIKTRDNMECSYYNEPPRDRGWYGKFNVKREKRSLLKYLFPRINLDFK
jgi:hypothetical protein